MAYEGWVSLAGLEVINSARTSALVEANLPTLDLRCGECEDLAASLNDPPYPGVVDGQAPWGEDPALADFYGLYPLSFTGILDSTYTTDVIESIGDGGTIGLGRRATRDMRITGLLIASSAIALDGGMAWLRGALRGSQCTDTTIGCNGDDMCFFAACPTPQTADDYLRVLRDCVVIEGPLLVREYQVTSGGAHLALVEFVVVAATPWVYSQPVQLGSTMGTPGTTVDLTVDYTPPALPSCVGIVDPPPVTDPSLPPLPSPPRPPTIALPGSNLSYGSGYAVLIPAEVVPATSDLTLVVTLRTGAQPARMVRLRLYAAPLAPAQSVRDMDGCSFCGEVVLSYIPPNSTMVLDGMNQTIYLEYPDGTQANASHLAFSESAIGVGWPVVSCDINYWFSVEFPGPETSQLIQGNSSAFATGTGSWIGTRPGAPTTTIALSPTHVVSVPNAMLASWPEAPASPPPAVTLTQVTLTPGRSYEWSGWVYVPTGSPPVRLGIAGASGEIILSDTSTLFDQYELLTVTAAAPSSTLDVLFAPVGPTASGAKVWIDEVQCRDLTTGAYSVVELSIATVRRA